MDHAATHTQGEGTGPDAVRRATRALRRGEAAQLQAALQVLDDADRHLAAQGLTAEQRDVERSAIQAQIAEAMQASERTVATLMRQARAARRELPVTWRRFRAGRIDARTLRRTVDTRDLLVHPASVEALDARVADYAESRRPAQIDAWLRRFVAVREADRFADRARSRQSGRGVWVEHLDDGMSYLHALLPTLTAEAVRNRLRAVATSPTQPVPHKPTVIAAHQTASAVSQGPEQAPEGALESHRPPETRADGDSRTLAQREADMFAAWLLTGRTAQGSPLDVQVGVLIPAESLTGESEAPGILRDRSHAIPAEQIRALISDPTCRAFWHQMRIAPTWETRRGETATGETPTGETAKLAGSGKLPTWWARPSPRSSSRRSGKDPGRDPLPTGEPLSEPPGEPLSEPPGEPNPGRDGASGITGVEFDVLSHVYTGRFVPRVLRDALRLRDGTCRAPGCSVAAERCDADHHVPWPHGETTAENLQMLCRRHHRMKSHGVLPRAEDTCDQRPSDQRPSDQHGSDPRPHADRAATGPGARAVDLVFPPQHMQYICAA